MEEISLTPTERSVLILSARGYKVNEIAEELCKSVDAIKTCKRVLFDKLQVRNISEAISYASVYQLL